MAQCNLFSSCLTMQGSRNRVSFIQNDATVSRAITPFPPPFPPILSLCPFQKPSPISLSDDDPTASPKMSKKVSIQSPRPGEVQGTERVRYPPYRSIDYAPLLVCLTCCRVLLMFCVPSSNNSTTTQYKIIQNKAKLNK